MEEGILKDLANAIVTATPPGTEVEVTTKNGERHRGKFSSVSDTILELTETKTVIIIPLSEVSAFQPFLD
ncbi:hypothetical protein ACJJIG_16165 [Microbulbifer sp. SSSA007]|uniref:hypothetical protein n=1 Tax=unclassified Microbulbifer TaxID=2619833 RepID=UPI00403A339B